MSVNNLFGKFPYGTDDKRPVLMRKENFPTFIYHPDFPFGSDLNWLLASTENETVGIYQLAPGSNFDPPDVHAGDEVYYVLKGNIAMLQPEDGHVVKLAKGDSILMPKGTPHKGYNFTNEEAVILFVIAPRIWDESGPPNGFEGKMKLYKFDRS